MVTDSAVKKKKVKNYKGHSFFLKNWFKIRLPKGHGVINLYVAIIYIKQNLLQIKGEMEKKMSYNRRECSTLSRNEKIDHED